jgi:PPM family protein phosphatase
MELEFYQLTSAGSRAQNQDYMAHILTDDYALFVVADGLGGYGGGEKASCFFCQGLVKCAETYSQRMAQKPVETFYAWIEAAVGEMKKLFSGDRLLYEAHTTCAILYMDRSCVLTAHCGDSRIYRMNSKQILWRSQDHSVPQALLQQGQIAEIDINRHPDQNRLTRSLNAQNAHDVEINVYPPAIKGETFIICSDGFWAQVKQSELLHLAQPSSGKLELGKVAGMSVLRADGKADNTTVQWVRCL